MFPMDLEVAVNNSGSVAGAIFFTLLGIAYLALFIGALISIAKSPNYTGGLKALWILACLAMPFVGSIVWFIWGKNGNSRVV